MGAFQLSLNNNKTFRKSNFLINAKYPSSLWEDRLMAICFCRVQERYNEDTLRTVNPESGQVEYNIPNELKVRLSTAQIREILGVGGGSIYEKVHDAALSLNEKSIIVEDPESKSFVVMTLFPTVQYADGIFTAYFNTHLHKMILNLQPGYTKLRLSLLSKYKHSHTIKLYENIRARCYATSDCYKGDYKYEVPVSVSELRFTLGLVNVSDKAVKKHLVGAHPDYDKAWEAVKDSDKSFKRWYDLQEKVIMPSIKEINSIEESDLKDVSYRPLKSGRGGKVREVIFTAFLYPENYKPPKEEVIDSEVVDVIVEPEQTAKSRDDILDEISDLIDEPLKLKDIRAIAEAAEYDIDKVKKAYHIMNSGSATIKSVTAFMIAAIKNEYEEAVQKEAPVQKNARRSGFNNFPQHDYDMEALEKLLVRNDSLTDEERRELEKRAFKN